MQFCPKCGKEVKYIATGYESVAVCEVNEITIVNERGHKFSGFLLHTCKAVEHGNGSNEHRSQ